MPRRLLLPLLLLLLPAWAAAAPLRLAVTVAPLAWLVDQLGGEQVAVQTLVRSGQDPHGFEPTPGQLAALQRADVYLALDLPFERAWLPRVRAANPALRVLNLVDHAHGHDHGADLDPHLWTDPQAMIAVSHRVAELLAELRPDQAELFTARQRATVALLQALDRDLAARFTAAGGRHFLVHHPAWGHLAARYGLTQLAIERHGKEPGPRALAELNARVRALGIDTVFVEPQASEHLAHGLADTLKLRVVQLDPLAADYPAGLRRAAAAIAEALR